MIKPVVKYMGVAALLMAGAANAETVNLDFSTYSAGTTLSALDGVSFDVSGGPSASGAPAITNWDNHGLSNSLSGEYPTGTTLTFTFTTGLASDISFNFDNYGLPEGATGRGNSTYTAYGLNGSVLSSGSVIGTGGNDFYALTGLSDVYKLAFNNGANGSDTSFDGSWLFDVKTLSATISPVPEPETYALMGIGLLGLFATSKRKKSTQDADGIAA